MQTLTRLEKLLFRLEAQRLCLEWAFGEIAGMPGIVFEMGLGHGRTYDHLRTHLPKREIYVLLRRFASGGKAIVFSSSDTPELVHLCDRVAVMREGGITAMIGHEGLSEEAIVAAAMGAEAARTAA